MGGKNDVRIWGGRPLCEIETLKIKPNSIGKVTMLLLLQLFVAAALCVGKLSASPTGQATGQTSLDAPAKAPEVTLGSEIRRGYQDVWAAKLPDDAYEKKTAVERIIQANDRAGRNTYGYLLGAHFGLWVKLEIAWEVYHDRAKARYEAVADSIWLRVEFDLLQAGLTLDQLREAFGPEASARIDRWKKYLNER